VGHDGGAGADALHGPKVLAERPRPLDRVHERAAGLGAALDLEPQHACTHKKEDHLYRYMYICIG